MTNVKFVGLYYWDFLKIQVEKQKAKEKRKDVTT